ncbi:MAG: hypothetical protein RMY28_037345 [Nostoc sp. ChiSLP01]|nr:hypothetical protein [Nostoc sp. CmiSLP01]MDZ8287358.1 hypothetical protein [Nostoc sp. ChiSLP01]
MNLTQLEEIITYIEQNFNRTQATGLNCLIFLSLREQTTIAYQRIEWGFTDIPSSVIHKCDSLDESDLLELATEIARNLLDELINPFSLENSGITTTAGEDKNAKTIDMQATEPNFTPTLLSDY